MKIGKDFTFLSVNLERPKRTDAASWKRMKADITAILEEAGPTRVARSTRALVLKTGPTREQIVSVVQAAVKLHKAPFPAGVIRTSVWNAKSIDRMIATQGIVELKKHVFGSYVRVRDKHVRAAMMLGQHAAPGKVFAAAEVMVKLAGGPTAGGMASLPWVNITEGLDLFLVDLPTMGVELEAVSTVLDGSQAATPPAPPPPPTRFLEARVPDRVRLGDTTHLEMRIALRGGASLTAELRPVAIPPEGLDVLLLLYAPGFSTPDGWDRRLLIPQRRDSDWTYFAITASKAGLHQIQVTAYAGATYLGCLSIDVAVDERQTAEPAVRTAQLEPRRREPGDVTLEIRYDEAQQVYKFRWSDETLSVEDDLDSERLLRSPALAVEDLVSQMNAVARGNISYSPDATRHWLRGKGLELWDEFIPEGLRRQFWERRNRIKRMMILSNGDPVPWELLYPRPEGGTEDRGFLAEQFTVSRWRFGPGPSSHLRIARAQFVSADGDPPRASDEIAAISKTLRTANVETPAPIRDLDELLKVFKSADFSLLHFACHNSFNPTSPTASRVLLRKVPFTTTFLTEHQDRFRTASPLVFMNACRTDGQAANYTRPVGWADSFLRAGAGAFVSSLWEVRDESARTFADEFYRALMTPKTSVGEALFTARKVIREVPGDPTWLAYTMYGDPAATIAPGPKL